MDYLKSFNVIALSFLLILTGCFGLFGDEESDSAEAEDSSNTPITAQDIADAMILASNSPPVITVKTYSFPESFDEPGENDPETSWDMAGYIVCPPEDGWDNFTATLAEQQLEVAEGDYHIPQLITSDQCVANFAFASVDPDGDTMTKGIDLDLDGLIDIPLVPANGKVIFGIDNSSLYDWPALITMSDSEGARMGNVALIAIDEHGASTAEIIHLVKPCLDCNENDSDPLVLYSFSGSDSPVADQVLITMAQGAETNFAILELRVSVDGGQSTICDSTCYGESGTANQHWSVGEDLTIAVSCGTGDTTCAVTVSIIRNEATIGVASVFME